MRTIADTGTSKEFPDSAVLHRDKDRKLLKVTDPQSSRTLWTAAGLTKTVALSKTNIDDKTMPSKRRIPTPNKSPTVTILENNSKSYPRTVQEAIGMLLGNANFQTLRTDKAELQDYFHGYLAGAHALLAIVSGSLGYDISFLNNSGVEKEKDDDTSTSASNDKRSAKSSPSSR